MKSLSIYWLGLLVFSFTVGCARLPIRDASQAMRPVNSRLEIGDDLHLEGVLISLSRHIKYLNKSPEGILHFGPVSISQGDYSLALGALQQTLQNLSSEDKFYRFVEENFQFYEVYGKRKWAEVFITGYYEPLVEGSLVRTERFSEPLYGLPKDMVYVRVDEFEKTFSDIFHPSMVESKKYIRGRLVKKEEGVSEVVPFYDRENMGKSQAPIIAWVDPIDLFFLQIQGSGTVLIDDSSQTTPLKKGVSAQKTASLKVPLLKDSPWEIPVGYVAQNGHPYVPIGKYLLDVIPLEEMSAQAIKKYLRTLPSKEAQGILNKNPSYVFFKRRTGGAMSSSGLELTPERTIATDPRFFPKGAMAFLSFKKPIFEIPESLQPQSWEKAQRFVFDQDTGGAIKGPGRLDLFWGRGALAGQAAGVMRHWGQLYYLVPKPSFLEEIKKTK